MFVLAKKTTCNLYGSGPSFLGTKNGEWVGVWWGGNPLTSYNGKLQAAADISKGAPRTSRIHRYDPEVKGTTSMFKESIKCYFSAKA